MGIVMIVHHIGTFFLFVAAILLLITTITAPVVRDLSMLTVNTPSGTITFGTFGYCGSTGQTQSVGDFFSSNDNGCSARTIGYSPVELMEALDQQDYGSAARNTADGLTRVQVLHPVVCGLAFISFLFAAGAGICGSLFAFGLAGLTFVLTVVVMATDFVAFGIVRDKVNGDGTPSTANFGAGMWTEVAAMVLLFFGMFIVLFSCCANRRTKKHDRAIKHESYAAGPTTTRRHFWQRRAHHV